MLHAKEPSPSDGLEKGSELEHCAVAPPTEHLPSLESLSEIQQTDTGTVACMNLSWLFRQCNFPFLVQVHLELPVRRI